MFPRKALKKPHHIPQKAWTTTTVYGNSVPLCSPTMHPTGVFPK